LKHTTGKYNYYELFKHITNPNVPAESFIGPLKVELSDTRGRGLYATRDIKRGELLSATKAYAFYKWNMELKDVSRTQRVNAAHEDMANAIFERINNNPEEALRVNMLCDGKSSPTHVSIEMLNNHYAFIPDNTTITLEKIRQIIRHNAYSVQYWCTNTTFMKQASIKDKSPFKTDDFGSGLWILDSFYNHSCDPNVISLYIGDVKFVRAVRDIKAGEECLIQYLDINESYNKRQKTLKDGYGF